MCTLLLVIRNTDGADGEVKCTVTAGAVAQGDILDLDTRSTGGTDLTIEKNAVWSGALQGVRHFTSLQKGTVNFNGETNISGDLSGNGATYNFSSSGGTIGGSVNLTNNSRTSGGTINTLIAVGGDVNVDQTSIFGGNWSIADNLSSQSALSPGDAIGVIKIGGNLNLTSTSVYEVNIDPNGGADMVSVDGTAELAGNIIVKPLNGFNLTSPYKILTANNIHGQFSGASFEKPTDFLNSFLHYSDNSVTLIVDRNNTSFSSAAQTSNQASVANALDHMPLSNPIVATIALSSREDARRAFDPLSGEIHASVMTGLIEDSQNIRNTAADRIRASFDTTDKSPATGKALWGAVFGSRGSIGETDNTAKFKRSVTGMLFGIDGAISNDWRIGALAGFSQSDYKADDRASSADADNYHLGLYGGTQWGAIGFRTGLAYTWSKIETSRSVSVPPQQENLSAKHDAGTFQVFGELGYKLNAMQSVFEPFANLAYVKTNTDRTTENGGSAALTTDRATMNTTFSTLGLRAATDLTIGNTLASPHGVAGWRYAGGDINPVVGNSFAGSNDFVINGARIARNAVLLEAGIKFTLSQNANLDLFYIGQYASGAQQNGFNSRLSINF